MHSKRGTWYGRLSFEKKTSLWGVLFLLPWLLGFLILFLVPMIQTASFSFHDLEIVPTGGLKLSFQGLKHFKHALAVDPTFNPLLTKTLIEVLLLTPLIIIFSLLCAILLNGKFKGRALARAIFFIPIIMATGILLDKSTSLSSQISQVTQNGSQMNFGAGMVAKLMFDLGIGQDIVKYLLDMINRIFEIVSLSGIQILIFLSALQSIPDSLYEVAKIEGATGYETFWKVTVVMVSPMILTNTVYTIAEIFSQSSIIQLTYDLAFSQSRYGLSSAMNFIFLIICLLTIGLSMLLLKKVVFYND